VGFIKNTQAIITGIEKYLGLTTGRKFTGRAEIGRIDREARGGLMFVFRTWWQAPGSVCVKVSRRFCSTCNLYMQVDMWSTRWIGQARGVAMHATGPCGQTCGGRGVSLHGSRPCIQTGRGCGVTLHLSRPC